MALDGLLPLTSQETLQYSKHWIPDNQCQYTLTQKYVCTVYNICCFLFYKILTVAVPIEQEGILQLELQIFVDRLHQVLCAESVHNSEAMARRGRPWMNRDYKNCKIILSQSQP